METCAQVYNRFKYPYFSVSLEASLLKTSLVGLRLDFTIKFYWLKAIFQVSKSVRLGFREGSGFRVEVWVGVGLGFSIHLILNDSR